MKVGFTGTQKGMVDDQINTFVQLLRNFAERYSVEPLANPEMEFHHGDCVGADADANNIVRGFSSAGQLPGFKIVSHPPIVQSKREFSIADEERPPKPYLERNHDIVDECDILIACTKGFKEEQRSGTWATIRYAIKTKKPVIIILPSGEVSER